MCIIGVMWLNTHTDRAVCRMIVRKRTDTLLNAVSESEYTCRVFGFEHFRLCFATVGRHSTCSFVLCYLLNTQTFDIGVINLSHGFQFVWLLPALRYASAVYAVVVLLSVCLSATSRCCIKTAKPRISKTTPHDG